MTKWKVGDKCEIELKPISALYKNCKILYIDDFSLVFNNQHIASKSVDLLDVNIEEIKTDAEIERERVVELAFKTAPMISNWTNALKTLYDAGMLVDPSKKVKALSPTKYRTILGRTDTVAAELKALSDGGHIIIGADNDHME